MGMGDPVALSDPFLVVNPVYKSDFVALPLLTKLADANMVGPGSPER